MEAPLRSASTTTPLLASLAAPAPLCVPSGKIPNAQPSARKARAARIAPLPPPSRSTGNDAINSKNFLKGKTKSCFFANHSRRRGTATQTRTGSAYWLWLEATIRGPSEGTLLPPWTLYPEAAEQGHHPPEQAVPTRHLTRFSPSLEEHGSPHVCSRRSVARSRTLDMTSSRLKDVVSRTTASEAGFRGEISPPQSSRFRPGQG